jgi:hypothetical protein
MNPVKKHSNTLFKPLSEINNVLHMSDPYKSPPVVVEP